ncbi:phosphonate ABC transporter, permease protein PhnE [Chloroflexus sp. MS-CIW-1]|jgi:phosphonate transport system permease protein|uniref:phosphonate ABC transporter, permease protein PhnE n=1 Tax=unclassified Chloroflexus TaxID=2633855 RepID=UPI0004DFA46F|nr:MULTISPECIES: phosphonate ABC transporter, permease protein PhnE [unclassified Chloroflexus]MBO9337858.1 phosphonate ABC transporter, permease protein PhnE [Chloroflexus sp.]MBO9347408.1 phosphonate ABC transporter, permease protein PhnE [Chloroflexus sp.]MDN5271769.1 phosphonate ABC transporter, permease protein PhnE [Chloroflexus sp. MS-CIW-1]
MQPDTFFRRRRLQSLLFFVVILSVTYGSIVLTQFDVVRGLLAVPQAFAWAVVNFIPDERAWSRLPNILSKLQETVLVAIASSTIAAVLGLGLALFGANTTRPHPWFSLPARAIASVFRNIDVSVWALILLFSFGQSGFTGFFALFFVTLGFITRVMIETIDEVGVEPIEALRATGASYGAIISQSVIPSCLPQLISWLLYMIETNIRSATLVGILTGTGIGFLFDLYFKNFNYGSASLVVLVTVAAVLLIETVSNAIRRIIL